MLKREDCPGLGRLPRIREMERQDAQRRVSILTGNNGPCFPLEIARAADGAVTGSAHPDVLAQSYDLFAAACLPGSRHTAAETGGIDRLMARAERARATG